MIDLLASIDPDALDAEAFDLMLTGAGIGSDPESGPELPDLTAGINAILNVCPSAFAEEVLVEFFNRIYRPEPS